MTQDLTPADHRRALNLIGNPASAPGVTNEAVAAGRVKELIYATIDGYRSRLDGERHLTKLKVKPRVGEEVGTQRVRRSAGQCEGSDGADRGTY